MKNTENVGQSVAPRRSTEVKIDEVDYKFAEARLIQRKIGQTANSIAKRKEKAFKQAEMTVNGKNLDEWLNLTVEDKTLNQWLDELNSDEMSAEKFAELVSELDPEQIDNIVLPSNIFNEKSGFEQEVDPATTEKNDYLSAAEKAAEAAMKKLMDLNVRDAVEEHYRLEKEKRKQMLNLNNDLENAYSENPKTTSPSKENNAITTTLDELKQIEIEEKAIENKSPEHFIVFKGFKLREYQKQISDGGIALTPYVAKNMSEVQTNMRACRPTFIHGNPGSGKTEMALMAAEEVAISRAATAEAKKQLLIKKIFDKKNNVEATQDEDLNFFEKVYSEAVKEFKNGTKKGEKEKVDAFRPILISGSNEITIQDLYAEKTLKLQRAGEKSLGEQLKDINAEIEAWKKANPNAAKNPDEVAKAEEQIRELYISKSSAYGTTVQIIENGVLKAVKEGRPVIIDEVNAIPASVLIGLNDLLTKKPGATVTIPGYGSVQIKKGFSIIMTGNLSNDMVEYFGTNELNTALKTRLDIMEHDFLPMSDKGSYKRQDNPDENELFQVLMAYQVDRQGNLTMPEIEKNIGKIYDLAKLAHMTHLIFSGKWKETHTNISGTNGNSISDPRLKSAVLTMRNILDVFKAWDNGSKMDLDTALWEGFIKGINNNDEKNLILALAQMNGFFDKDEGWNVQVKRVGDKAPSRIEDIRQPGEEQINYNRLPLETYDLRHTVEAIYGEIPERQQYPDDETILDIEEDIEKPFTEEEYAEKQEQLETAGKIVKALMILGEMNGCPKVEVQ